MIFRVYVDLPEGMRYGFGFASLSQTEPFQQLSTISPFQWRVILPSDAAIGTCQQQRLFMRGQRQPEVTLQALHPIERGSKNPGAGGGFVAGAGAGERSWQQYGLWQPRKSAPGCDISCLLWVFAKQGQQWRSTHLAQVSRGPALDLAIQEYPARQPREFV